MVELHHTLENDLQWAFIRGKLVTDRSTGTVRVIQTPQPNLPDNYVGFIQRDGSIVKEEGGPSSASYPLNVAHLIWALAESTSEANW